MLTPLAGFLLFLLITAVAVAVNYARCLCQERAAARNMHDLYTACFSHRAHLQHALSIIRDELRFAKLDEQFQGAALANRCALVNVQAVVDIASNRLKEEGEA